MQLVGMVVVCQRLVPAKRILLLAVADERGLLDPVVKPDVDERLRSVLRRSQESSSSCLRRRGGRVEDLEPLLGYLLGQAEAL